MKIRWGNVFILLLIIAAGVMAFYYKYPNSMNFLNRDNKDNQNITSSGKNEESSSNSTKNSSNKGKLIMGLDSWIGGTPIVLGLNREYNRDYSLDLAIEYLPNDEDRIKALKAGNIQFTEMSLPSFTRLQEKYPDSGVIIGITDFSTGADGIIARSDVKTLNDMDGKRVSYVGDGTGKFLLNKFLRLTGLRYQDIKPIEQDEMSDVIDDLKNGKADLAVSWSPDMNLAVKEINSGKPGSVKLLITTKEVPTLIPTVLVANKQFLENSPEKVEAFLKTWYASVKYIIERPDKAYEKLSLLMAQEKDVYGAVTQEEVTESFTNIKLIPLNETFDFFGINTQDKKLEIIIDDTIKTWQKYGDMSDRSQPQGIVSYEAIAKLFKENDKEILVVQAGQPTAGSSSKPAETNKDFKQQDAVSIEKNTEKVAKVDIPLVYYDSGASTVKQESLPVLDEVLAVLAQFPQYYLIIDAHTDSVGSEDSNLKLSKDRAAEVKAYLTSKGINSNRVVARGWGESKLLVIDEKNDEDRAKNRRTEFILTREIPESAQ